MRERVAHCRRRCALAVDVDRRHRLDAEGPRVRAQRTEIARSSAAEPEVVADQGRGLSHAEQIRVFDKFERLGRSGDGGSGLGLYISARLARAIGLRVVGVGRR